MSSLRSALAFSFAGKYISLITQFVSVIIISRILTPQELGIYSLAAGSVVIGQMLRDFGLSVYLIKEEHLSKEKINGCFTISIILCWSIALIYTLASGPIAEFFEQEYLATLIKILAINFLLIPFGTFTLSILKRNMMFDKIMIIDTVSNTLSAGLSVALVYNSFGPISLAYASVLGTLITVIMTLRYSKFEHFRIDFSQIKTIGKFSSIVSLTNILGELRQTLPEIVIGKHINAESVAYYNKASSTAGLFSTIIMQAITPTLQPYLADLKRRNVNANEAILNIYSYIQVISFSFYVFLYAFSEQIILVLYGPQWSQTPELLEIIAISMLIVNIIPSTEQILTIIGKEKYVLKVTAQLIAIRVLYLVLFVYLDLTIAQLLYLFMTISILRLMLFIRPIMLDLHVKITDLAKVTIKNLAIAAILLASFYIEKSLFDDHINGTYRLLLEAGITAIAWVSLILIFRHPLSYELKKIVHKIMPGTKS